MQLFAGKWWEGGNGDGSGLETETKRRVFEQLQLRSRLVAQSWPAVGGDANSASNAAAAT